MSINKSINSNNTDNSINSKETEISSSFESQTFEISNLNEQIINSIVLNLEIILKENKSLLRNVPLDIFYSPFTPSISLSDYIKLLMEYSKMDISTLIISIIYIDRFCHINNYILTENNIYRILLSACLLSIKFNEDILKNIKDFLEIGDVSIKILNKLEFQMYLMLHFSLKVNIEFYQTYYNYFRNYQISDK